PRRRADRSRAPDHRPDGVHRHVEGAATGGVRRGRRPACARGGPEGRGAPVPRRREGARPAGAARELPFPVVVKAPGRQGQRGLALVRSPGELEAALAAALAESRGGAVLVEEHVEGPEGTVNAVSVDGRFVPLTVTARRTAEPPAFGVALAHLWPSRHDTAAAVDAAAAAGAAGGVPHGPPST